MPDIDQISELKHQISIDTLVITDLRNKVERWHGLTRDIVTVLGNNTDMFHECMDSWIDLMVDTNERETMKALAQSIVDRLHEIKRSEWTDPFSCMDNKLSTSDKQHCLLDQSHFLAWLSAYKPMEHNSLLAEYYYFCKDNPEKANIL